MLELFFDSSTADSGCTYCTRDARMHHVAYCWQTVTFIFFCITTDYLFNWNAPEWDNIYLYVGCTNQHSKAERTCKLSITFVVHLICILLPLLSCLCQTHTQTKKVWRINKWNGWWLIQCLLWCSNHVLIAENINGSQELKKDNTRISERYATSSS